MKAVYVVEFGGPEKLIYGDLETPKPGKGQALVKVHASGVNFIDIYFRTGLYKAEPPVVLGNEGAGVVEAVGEDVTEVKPGDRVAWAMERGSYAEFAVVPVWKLVPVPEGVELRTAAASMLQGMTAHYLTHSTFELKPGHTALVHAAAGGTGQWIVAAAKQRGARVIGTASTAAKVAVGLSAGCDHVINYTESDFAKEARRLTDGRGVDVVYDSVGAATWEGSLDALKVRGMMVSFGNASGPVPPIAPLSLAQKGSLYLTRPSLAQYALDREEIRWRAEDVFRWLAGGAMKLHIDEVFLLSEAGKAQEALGSRKSVGKLLLVPEAYL